MSTPERGRPSPELQRTLDSLPPMDFVGRIAKLRAVLVDQNLDAIVLSKAERVHSENVRWATGFTGTVGMVVVTATGVTLFADSRYTLQASAQLRASGIDGRVVQTVTGDQQQRDLRTALDGCVRVGFESEAITHATASRWRNDVFAAYDLVPTNNILEGLRRVKDAGEIARIRAASAVVDEALAAVLPLLHTGLTEREFGRELDLEIRRRGATGNSFETIVASGENGARPHHRPADRLIGQGDLVTIDVGSIVDGYCSDMTRTVSVGEPRHPELLHIWELVRDAQAAAVAVVAPGVEIAAVDRACRDMITAAGHGPDFGHGTGHGVGLDVHEEPWVSGRSTDVLKPGNIVTVEPGVYIAGLGGVRIEDTVVVTETGYEALTLHDKVLIVA